MNIFTSRILRLNVGLPRWFNQIRKGAYDELTCRNHQYMFFCHVFLKADVFGRHCPGCYECNSVASQIHHLDGEVRSWNRRLCGTGSLRFSFWGKMPAPWPTKRVTSNGSANVLHFTSSLLGWCLGVYQQRRVPRAVGWRICEAVRGPDWTTFLVLATAGRKCSAERKILFPDQRKAGTQNEQTLDEGEGARQRREAFDRGAVSQLW